MRKFSLLLAITAIVISAVFAYASSPSGIYSVDELELRLGSQAKLDNNLLKFDVEIIPNVSNINITNNLQPQNETAMAVNPADTRNIIVSMNDFSNGLSGQTIAFSKDGGLTWELRAAAKPASNIYYIDPSVAFDSNGNAYIAYLAVKQGAQLKGTAIAVVKSTDGGNTWQAPVFVANNFDNSAYTHSRPFISVNPANNNILVSWVITEGQNAYPVMAQSNNGGASFGSWVAVSNQNGAVRNAIAAADLAGNIYVAYFDLQQSITYVAKSTDNGVSFQTVHSFSVEQIGEAVGFRRILKGAVKVNSYPWIAVDNSETASQGNIYLVWADNRNGNADILMTKSTDAGQSWSEPTVVNNDQTNLDQFFPTVAVDQATGALNIAFYDSRNDANNELVDTYIAQSVDGGETFINQRVSTASSNPKVGFDQGGQKFFGDYLAVTAYNNVVYSAFTDSREGNQEIFVATFNKNGDEPAVNTATQFELEQNYPNPFNPATKIRFTLSEPATVTLRVYNNLGQVVATLINNQLMDATAHEITFEGLNLPSGIYFYRLETPQYGSTKKMLLNR
ncbi:MAG: hypothetical protein Kow0037_31030 [Calditrichia bacterium]